MTYIKKNSAIQSQDELDNPIVLTQHNSVSSSSENCLSDLTSLNEDFNVISGSSMVDENIDFRSTDSVYSQGPLKTTTEPVSIFIESPITEVKTSPLFNVKRQKKSTLNKVSKIQPN